MSTKIKTNNTSIASAVSTVQAINTEVDSQAAKLAELEAALDGKAVSGGGGTEEGYVTAAVAIYTNAKNGMDTSRSAIFMDTASGYKSQSISSYSGDLVAGTQGVKCGSFVLVSTRNSSNQEVQITFDSITGAELYSQNVGVAVFKITAAADGVVTIVAGVPT